jgi:hypothetical protein
MDSPTTGLLRSLERGRIQEFASGSAAAEASSFETAMVTWIAMQPSLRSSPPHRPPSQKEPRLCAYVCTSVSALRLSTAHPVKGNLAFHFNNRFCIAGCAQMFAHQSSAVLDERDQARAA